VNQTKIVFDCILKRPGCPLIQAAMGGDVSLVKQEFHGDTWLTFPTEGMKLYPVSETQVPQLVGIAEQAVGLRKHPHLYGGGSKLSQAYTHGRQGRPFPKRLGTKQSATYKAWKIGCEEWKASGKEPSKECDHGTPSQKGGE
jgi:hypothetical protein